MWESKCNHYMLTVNLKLFFPLNRSQKPEWHGHDLPADAGECLAEQLQQKCLIRSAFVSRVSYAALVLVFFLSRCKVRASWGSIGSLTKTNLGSFLWASGCATVTAALLLCFSHQLLVSLVLCSTPDLLLKISDRTPNHILRHVMSFQAFECSDELYNTLARP